MCFGGKGGGGNQGGGSSQEDGEVRKAHREAGISAADTRRYFREKENPAHMRNKNAAGGTTSVSHSRDEGGNLVAKQVDYGQGSFAPPPGVREGDQSLAMNQQKAIRRDFIRDNKFLPDRSSLSDNLVAQNLSRTNTYKPQSDLFRNSTPEQIKAIRAANKAKDSRDQDGDGSWLTSTDNMGRVAGIGTTGDGSGSQPYIYDPYLPEGYQGIPQVDPNRGADTNLTMFGKAMRKVGGPIVANMMGPLAPVAGAMLLANKYPDKVPSFLTGRGTYAPAYDEPIGPNRPSIVAPPNQSETSSTSTSGSALSRIQSPYPQLRPTASQLDGQRMVNLNDPKGRMSTADAGSPVFDRSETRLKNMGTADIGALSAFDRPQLRPTIMNANTLDEANRFGETIMVDGYPDRYAQTVPVSTYFRALEDPNPDLNFPQVMPRSATQQRGFFGEGGEDSNVNDSPTVYNDTGSNVNDNPTFFGEGGSNVDDDSPYITTSDNVTSPYFNYRKWTPSDPTYLGQSSYGGKWSTGASGVASTAPVGIYSSGDPSAQVLTDFYNPVTGQYFTAPNASFYAEAGSNWKRGRPTSSLT